MKNNTSFDKKQHVVWQKTTRHLKRSKYSPTQYDQQGYELQVHSLSYNKCEIAVESPLSTRACKQEFYHFCCHKCHRLLPIFLCSNTLQPILRYILTDKWFKHSKSAYHNNEKHTFRPFLLLFSSIFFSTFSLLV